MHEAHTYKAIIIAKIFTRHTKINNTSAANLQSPHTARWEHYGYSGNSLVTKLYKTRALHVSIYSGDNPLRPVEFAPKIKAQTTLCLQKSQLQVYKHKIQSNTDLQ